MTSTLPKAWTESTFGSLNNFSSKTISPQSHPLEEFELYSVPAFPSGEPEICQGKDIGSTKQIVHENSILVCKINPRINRVWEVPPSSGARQIASSEWIGFWNEGLNARFYQYYFRSNKFRSALCADVTGVGGSLTRAQPKKAATIAVPVAPINEQRRIADKLDRVLARVDAANEHLSRVAPLIKRFRQSVLAAATSGRLTADWRTGEKSEPWDKTAIHEVAEVGTGSTPLRTNRAFYAGKGTPWITSSATQKDIVDSSENYVTQDAIQAHRLKLYPPGTLLIAMYGEGKTRGQVTELGIHATINQACAAIRITSDKTHPKFVKIALKARYNEMRDMAEGGNQPNLNLQKVKNFAIPLPSLEEQSEIVRRVEKLFAFADRLEERLSQAQAAVQKLTPALLAKAFRGELVPQDPNDEPASELLKRLQESRTESAKPRRAHKPRARKAP